MDENFKVRLKQVKAFFFDVDGVLTDGGVLAMPDGDLLRTMYIRDGYALKLAREKGYQVIIISGGKSNSVVQRLNNLGLSDIFISVSDKVALFHEMLIKYNLKKEETLYMGDDMPDLAVIQLAGISSCPDDAVQQIKSKCIYVSPYAGGKGCARDVIEQVMTLHGTWE